MTYDAIVVGGGPAGAIFAAVAAQAGKRVALVDPLARRRHPIGECLPGSALHLLHEAGFAPSGIHRRLGGTISRWGGPAVMADDHFANPFGPGLCLDRVCFDSELRQWAITCGAEIVSDRTRDVVREAGGRFRLEHAMGPPLRTRFLVDASGPSAFAARRMGAHRRTTCRLFSVYGTVAATNVEVTRSLVETDAQGWWYAIVLPAGRVLAAYHCDAGLARRLAHDPCLWRERLAATTLIAPCFVIMTVELPKLSIVDASTSLLDCAHGPRWLAIGDAAQTYDPVTSHGLFAAARDAIDGARAVVDAVQGNDQLLHAFIHRRAQRHVVVERQRRATYRSEITWRDAPFWTERQ